MRFWTLLLGLSSLVAFGENSIDYTVPTERVSIQFGPAEPPKTEQRTRGYQGASFTYAVVKQEIRVLITHSSDSQIAITRTLEGVSTGVYYTYEKPADKKQEAEAMEALKKKRDSMTASLAEVGSSKITVRVTENAVTFRPAK